MTTRRELLMGAGTWALANTVVAGLARGQQAPAANGLRVGAAFTEPDARAFMARKTALYATRDLWQSAAPRLRAGMLRGMGIDPTVKRPPLAAIRNSRKERNGYTVENVAIDDDPDLELHTGSGLAGVAGRGRCGADRHRGPVRRRNTDVPAGGH